MDCCYEILLRRVHGPEPYMDTVKMWVVYQKIDSVVSRVEGSEDPDNKEHQFKYLIQIGTTKLSVQTKIEIVLLWYLISP